MNKFINFYGDFVQYTTQQLWEYENDGGDFNIDGKQHYKGEFSHVIKFPFNKGYIEEKLIKQLLPRYKHTYDKENKVWLIHKYIV